tara:strand:+ start:886 stop:1566 length:681 start_codon:yes stop_codon:yes gene_type:complete
MKIKKTILLQDSKFWISIILIIFSIISTLKAEIVLHKNDVIITNTDVTNYQKLYKDFFGNEINRSKSVKNLYTIIKIIDRQIQINPNFIKQTDVIIQKDIKKYETSYSNYILSYFLRYEILKKDYIAMYTENNNLNELDKLLKNKITIYKDNNCKIKIKSVGFSSLNKKQKQALLYNLSSEIILIEDSAYLCLDNEIRQEIKNIINNLLSFNGNKKFLEYVFKNIK